MSSIVQLSERIVQAFDPGKIILFGSYAYGRPAEYSDVDLLVIMPFEGSSSRKALEIVRRVEPPFASCPIGANENSPAFQRWDRWRHRGPKSRRDD